MRVSGVQRFNFRKIDPALKKEIIEERKKITNNPSDLKCFENSLNYLEYTDAFELKKSPDEKGCYQLEFTSPFIHKGPIEHFLKPEFTEEVKFTDPAMYRACQKYAKIYGNNFANRTYEDISNSLLTAHTIKGVI